MGKASPAFQFYPDAFDGGTARMTLSEVGGYMRLLNEQWVSGSIPGDDHAALSRVMRCTPGTARSVWKVVGAKFVRHAENDWRNERLEKERAKQDARREALAANGQAGAEKRWANHDKPIVNAIAGPIARPMAKEKQTDGLPSLVSDLRSLEIPEKVPDLTTSTPSVPVSAASPPPVILTPIQYAKLRERHAFVGSRLRIPNVLHDELRTSLGGDEPDLKLQDWYQELNDEADRERATIPDVYAWVRPRFRVWAQNGASAAQMDEFMRDES